MITKIKKIIVIGTITGSLCLYGCDDNGSVSCIFEAELQNIIIPGVSTHITGTIGYGVLPNTAVCNWYDWAGRGCWPTLVTQNYTPWVPHCTYFATGLVNKYTPKYNKLASLKITNVTISCSGKEHTCEIVNDQCVKIIK